MDRLRVGVVGATGVVGQQFLVALDAHPWFEVAALAASERSAGKRYLDAIRDERTGALRWFCREAPPTRFLDMGVEDASKLEAEGLDLVFTGVESDAALELEPMYASRMPVVSTASAFRYEPDVPIIVPGVNSGHAKLIETQRAKRGWRGFITPIPNCTTTGLVITLKPIHDSFGLRTVIMTSMQGLSGAGRSPGVVALDIVDNVIPFIPKEEEKVQRETLKILGALGEGGIKPAEVRVSCTCTRVAVLEGHTESVFLSTKQPCGVDDVKEAMRRFNKENETAKLPSAPREMIVVNEDPFRPQPRLDRDTYDGMATTVGRIRRDEALENGVKYMLVSHNTKMGAAKGAVLVAETLASQGYV